MIDMTFDDDDVEELPLKARAEKRKRCGTYDGRRYLEVVADAQNLDVLASREQRC